ncbi:AAA family ATPase [Aliarcobacter butzleri]|uniref:AAA family ATPase n=1 Tax=Aliarcobacter butzleri TaxID=28197 RepID=UPI00344FA834
MELVYLWVEDYKNIKKQGFNFSPRFRCEFKDEYEKYIDTDGKEKERLKNDCKLIINEDKDYISIFPDNINITAIVGENGSGKSSLLESLIDIFSKSISNDEDYSKYILIYTYKGKYFYLKKHILENINIVDKDKNTINCISENLNDKLFTQHSELLGLIIQNEVTKNIYVESEQIFIEEVQNKDKNKIKKYIVVNSLFDSKFKKESNKFFDVKNVEIKIKWGNLFDSEKEGNKYEIETLAEIETKFNEIKQIFENKKYKDTFLNIIDLCEMKIKKLKRSGFFEFVHFTEDPYISNQFRYEKLYNCFSHIEENQNIKSVHQLVINDLDKYDNFTFKIEELEPKIIDFIFDLPEYIFDIQLKDEYKSFEDLSFGERQLLTQLNFIQFYINKKQYIQYESIDFHLDKNNQKHKFNINVEKKVKNMIVLIDELEIGLHPNWQKNAINYIFDFLQNIKDIDFNLIITSHSPFILSDLPKENIIFLEKGKQVYPFEDGKQTFGANIHTLLSHGFFMKDGLMGEFAKEKINQVYNFITQKGTSFIKTKEEAQNIINLIGEPMLKKELQYLYDEKFEIDDIDKQIREYEEAIEKLKSKKKKND